MLSQSKLNSYQENSSNYVVREVEEQDVLSIAGRQDASGSGKVPLKEAVLGRLAFLYYHVGLVLWLKSTADTDLFLGAHYSSLDRYSSSAL